MKNLKTLLIEIGWFLGCAVVSYIMFIILPGNSGLDINLHDTYFVVKVDHAWISFLIIISFFVYYFRELKHSFSRKTQRSFILFLGFSLILLTSLAVQLLPFFNPYQYNGWTVYPPLPVQPELGQIKHNFISLTIVSRAALIFQIAVVTMMLSIAYKWGKSNR